MVTEINESKTLTKHILCKCKWRFDGRKCNSDQWWSNDKCQCACRKRHVCEKDYDWNPATCNILHVNGKYLASIMGDSVITCDEIIDAEAKSNNEERKTNFNEKISL